MIDKKNVTGSDALKYLQEQLNIGGTLANYINVLSLEKGQIYSLVPKSTLDENLYKFNLGGIYPFDKELLNTQNVIPVRNDARLFMINEIQNHLKISESNCCLFEDTVNAPSDIWIKNSSIQYVYIKGKEMFYYFDKYNESERKISKAVSNSENYSFTCGLSSMNINKHKKFASFKEIDLELIKSFAENISLFFVRAYDGEGYLMWTNLHQI